MSDPALRPTMAGEFNELRRQIDSLASKVPDYHPFTFVARVGTPAGAAYQDVSSGAFVVTHSLGFPNVHHDVVVVTVAVAADGGTTGEVRVGNAATGAASAASALAAGATTTVTIKWRHGQALGSGSFYPTVEVRRTGGTGVLHVQPVDFAYLTTSRIEPAAV